jgi:peptidoglycan/LPS O-acetylase OafA/YrhL
VTLPAVTENRSSPSPSPERAIAEAEAPNLTPPPGNPRFPLFDSLRAIAALSVFLGHTVTGTMTFGQPLYPYGIELAVQGVAVFFLISGFLLYRPFLVARRSGRGLSVPAFARRRLLRIVPAYWAALSIFLLVGVVSGVTSHNWWIFYGFGQIYSTNDIGHGIGAAWTLCIEVTFYAMLPVFSAVAARLGPHRASIRADLVLIVALSIGSMAFRTQFNSFSDFATLSTLPATFTWFAFGMLLAIASVMVSERRVGASRFARAVNRPILCWTLAVAAFLALHQIALRPNGVLRALSEHVLYAIVALFVLLPGVFGEQRSDPVRRLLRTSSLTWIGLISYGFYLYHTIVIQELVKPISDAATGVRWVVILVGGFTITTICAAVSYYLLERPCMRLGRRRRAYSSSARRSSSLETAD